MSSADDNYFSCTASIIVPQMSLPPRNRTEHLSQSISEAHAILCFHQANLIFIMKPMNTEHEILHYTSL